MGIEDFPNVDSYLALVGCIFHGTISASSQKICTCSLQRLGETRWSVCGLRIRCSLAARPPPICLAGGLVWVSNRAECLQGRWLARGERLLTEMACLLPGSPKRRALSTEDGCRTAAAISCCYTVAERWGVCSNEKKMTVADQHTISAVICYENNQGPNMGDFMWKTSLGLNLGAKLRSALHSKRLDLRSIPLIQLKSDPLLPVCFFSHPFYHSLT